MHNSHRTAGRRPGIRLLTVLASFAMVAGACGSKKDEDATAPSGSEAPTADEVVVDEPDETEASAVDGTDAPVVDETDAPVETDAPALAPVLGGKLIVAGEAEVANPWTPSAMQCDSYCQMRARSFYDPLMVANEDLEPTPFLAESITPNDDFTQWTVKLRSGIKFHDGTDLDADALIYNINASFGGLLISAAVKDIARDPACWKAEAGVVGNAACPVVIDKVDDMTATIHTGFNGNAAEPLPWPGFIYYLGGQGAFMASPTWLEAVKAGTAAPDQPVGTGPFMYSSYAPGDKLVVKKNPNYWLKDANGGQLPYLDEIEFRVIPDGPTRADALRAGDVDMIATSDANSIAELQDDAEFPAIMQDTFAESNYILLHLSKEGSPLQDTRVRCALGQAIEKTELIDLVGGGILKPSNGPFSPGQEGHLEDNGSLPYDPDAAAAAIEAFEAETGTQVTINYSTTTSSTNLILAEYLQEVWTDIGVDVTIDQIEQSKLINNALFGDPAFDAFGWRNHAGLFPDQQYYWWHSSAAIPDGGLALNFGRLADPEIDKLLEAGRTEADPATRKSLAEDLNRQFAKECWVLPWAYTLWGVFHTDAVAGIATLPLPAGGIGRDGAGFSGQVWLASVFKTA